MYSSFDVGTHLAFNISESEFIHIVFFISEVI